MANVSVHSMDSSLLLSRKGLECIERIINRDKYRKIFVLTPMSCEELDLQPLLLKAQLQDEKLWSLMESIYSSWKKIAMELLRDRDFETVLNKISQDIKKLEDILKGIWHINYVSVHTIDYLRNMVTRWAALIACSYLDCSTDITDAVSVFTYSENELSDAVFVYGSIKRFEGSDRLVESEYLASVAAGRFDGRAYFWNSQHIYTADIADVPSARVIENLSYQEAIELSYFGAPVIHPQSIAGAIENGTEIRLCSINDVDGPQTLISAHSDRSSGSAAKGFSSIKNVALINIEGGGMSGVVGISSRLFSSLKDADISVILISQASSEYSISVAVYRDQGERARDIIRNAFSREIESREISSVTMEDDCAIVAAVGSSMIGRLGVSGMFFSSLGKANVNVRAIAQGCSETNISAVVKLCDVRRAIRALHASFFLSEQTLSVGLIGPGSIGSALLEQIDGMKDQLRSRSGLDIRVRAIANSRRMLMDENGIDLSCWRDRFEKESVEIDLERFASFVSATYFPHSSIVDCTSSQKIADLYTQWMERGINIVTPNKKAGTSNMEQYDRMFETSNRTGKRFYYESTVGAGLPVIKTLQDFVLTGDKVFSIEGIFSGTLAWLFNEYDGSVPFSQLVRKAREMGFTEPDPRDDLSGMDVGRKTVILARELGYRVEVSDIDIPALYPHELDGCSIDEFLDRLVMIDDDMLSRYQNARERGMKMKYVGKIDRDGRCTVELGEYPLDHPFCSSSGTDNVISFTTARYLVQPLVIRGPGAGREVTAGGVFADLLRLSAYLGARL